MSLFNVITRMTGTPWAITHEAMQTIVSIAERTNEKPEAVAARMGRELDNTHTVELRDGVAIIPVNGPLFRYANLFTMISGATSYQMLATDLQEALDNPAVKSIMLNIDSPGGDVNGLSEFANMIYAARSQKPITAYVGGTAASAAYWIASAASEIVLNDTSMVGSIGTVFTLEKRESPTGTQRIEIVSSQSPKKRPDIATSEGKNQIQAWADQLSEIFIDTVARNRGISSEKVMNEFGQGDMLIGARAIALGMADRLGSFESVIAELSNRSSVKQFPFAAGASTTTMEKIEMATEQATAATTEGAVVITADASTPVAPDIGAITAAAATAERERVFAILNSDEAKTRPTLAKKLASKAGMSAADALDLLSASAEEQTAGSGFAAFDAAMTAENPTVEAGESESEPDEQSGIASVLALAKQHGIQ
jgi:ClpP class serine protease